MALFWADLPETKARLRLNENLSRLRKELPDPDIILSEGNLVGLDHGKVTIDQIEFENLIDQAGHTPWKIPENDPLPETILKLLESAANLWRGPHFLSGNILPSIAILETWQRNTGNRLEHQRVSILQRLADHTFVGGDLEKALKYIQNALENDFLNENLHDRALRYLIDLGNLEEARQHFDHVQEIYRTELDIAPPAKLISQYQRIRKIRTTPIISVAPKWEIHTSIDLPYVGRKETLNQIRQILLKNKGVFILGEAGQGKTRLIKVFSSQMQPKNRVLVTTCRPLETALPFQPIIEIFRRYILPDEWLTLPAIWASRLTQLYSALKGMRPELADPLVSETPSNAQADLLEAIQQIFILLAEQHPLLLVFDDAHWADEATLTTIGYLLSRPPFDGVNGSIVILSRRDEITPALENLYNLVQDSKHSEIVYLPQLESSDLYNLTYYLLGAYPTDGFVRNLVRSTGGNPLYVLETLRSILEKNPKGRLDKNTRLPLAKSLQTLIQTRLQKVSFIAKNILDIAAVIGMEFDYLTIQDITDQDEDTLVRGLDELEQRMILQTAETPGGEVRYRFFHDKFREAVIQNLSQAKSHHLNKKVAQHLEKEYFPEQAGVLAQHFETAGEFKSAYHYWVASGNRARNLFSITDAFRSFQRAKSLFSKIENNLSDNDIYQLFAHWSEMAYEIQDTDLVRQLGNELVSLGEKRASSLLIGTGLDALSDACMTENKFEEGLELATRAISFLEQCDSTFELMEAYIHCGVFHYMTNDINKGLAAFEDALALATDDTRPEVIRARSNAHYQMSLLRTISGWPQRGYEHAQRSLRDANASGRTYLKFSAYFVLTFSCYYLGHYHEANEHAHNGIQLAEQTHGWRMLGYLHSYAAAVDLSMGNVDQAYQHALESQRLGKEYDLNELFALGCRQLGDIHLRLGAALQAIPYYQSGVEAIGEHFIGGDNLMRMGFASFQAGNIAMGQQLMAFALAAFENTNVGMGIYVTKIQQATVEAELQNWDEVTEIATEVMDQTTERSLSVSYLEAVYLMGLANLESGASKLAGDQFTNVIEEAKLLGNIWLELKAQISITKSLAAQDPARESSLERIEAIKKHLRSNTQNPDLVEIFQSNESQIGKF
jgi:DNA-binding SARP family transcriptional activator